MSGQRRWLKLWARTVGMPIGITDDDKKLVAQFNITESSQDLSLSLTGWDLDFENEIKLTLNGNDIGYLDTSRANNKQTSEHNFVLEKDFLVAGDNELIFENVANPYYWGITDLLISEDVIV